MFREYPISAGRFAGLHVRSSANSHFHTSTEANYGDTYPYTHSYTHSYGNAETDYGNAYGHPDAHTYTVPDCQASAQTGYYQDGRL